MDLTFVWDVNPEIPFLCNYVPIRYYGILFTTGLILGYFVVRKLYQIEGLKVEHLDVLTNYIFIATIVGARLGHCLFYEPNYYLSHPLEMILPIKWIGGELTFVGYQGLASHGGTIGVFIAIVLFCWRYKKSVWSTLDKIAIAAPLTGCFIRLGNFMNSEIIGVQTNADWGVIFQKVDSASRHPAQLYEAFVYLIIFIGLVSFYRKYGQNKASGFIFGLSLVLIFTARFFIEFVKINQVSFEQGMPLNMGQILSIPIVLLCGLVMYWKNRAIKVGML